MEPSEDRGATTASLEAAVLALLVLTGVMLLALFTRTEPHPPLAVPPFALGPFLGASLALGLAAHRLLRSAPQIGAALAALFAVTALVSFGPQKYLDPAFAQIWPAVIVAQLAVLCVLASAVGIYRRAGRR